MLELFGTWGKEISKEEWLKQIWKMCVCVFVYTYIYYSYTTLGWHFKAYISWYNVVDDDSSVLCFVFCMLIWTHRHISRSRNHDEDKWHSIILVDSSMKIPYSITAYLPLPGTKLLKLWLMSNILYFIIDCGVHKIWQQKKFSEHAGTRN